MIRQQFTITIKSYTIQDAHSGVIKNKRNEIQSQLVIGVEEECWKFVENIDIFLHFLLSIPSCDIFFIPCYFMVLWI